MHNNAEILGLVLGLLSGSSESPTPGTPAWAVEQTILEKWPSIEAFGAFFDAQSLAERRVWISQLKGRAAEHLVAHETGGEAHNDWNIPDHDVVTPEGKLIQVKAGSSIYVEEAADNVPDDIAVHTGEEGKGVDGVTAHDWSAVELEDRLQQADVSEDQTLEILGGSIVGGLLLSGRQTYKKIRSGEVALNEVPRFMAVDSAGNSVRCAVIGVATTSGSPVIVSAGVGYVLLRNRALLGRLCGYTYRTVTHPCTKQAAKGVGRLTKSTAILTYRAATNRVAKQGGRLVVRGVTKSGQIGFRSLARRKNA